MSITRKKTGASLVLVFALMLPFPMGVLAKSDDPEQVEANKLLGKRAFFRCRACHSLNKDDPHKVGPNLYGLFGREAGSLTDFKYSDAVKSSGVIWDRETLMLWLQSPATFIPNNQMAYAGTKSEKELDALIAYLASSTIK